MPADWPLARTIEAASSPGPSGTSREYDMERQPIESSLIRSVGYDLDNSVLEVEIIGTVGDSRVYEYFDVPLSIYNELMEAASKGAYFNEMIRDMYPYREIESAGE